MCYLRPLRRLKCQTDLKTSSKSKNYDTRNLLNCLALDGENTRSIVHQKDKLLRKKLWKCNKRRLKERNQLGGVLFFKSKFLVPSIRTCYDPVCHSCNSTVNTCTDGTTEHTQDDGLGINICCSGKSKHCFVLCQRPVR